jgi:hypothetical protein
MAVQIAPRTAAHVCLVAPRKSGRLGKAHDRPRLGAIRGPGALDYQQPKRRGAHGLVARSRAPPNIARKTSPRASIWWSLVRAIIGQQSSTA